MLLASWKRKWLNTEIKVETEGKVFAYSPCLLSKTAIRASRTKKEALEYLYLRQERLRASSHVLEGDSRAQAMWIDDALVNLLEKVV